MKRALASKEARRMPLLIVPCSRIRKGRHKYLCRSLLVFTYALHCTETEDFALTTNH